MSTRFAEREHRRAKGLPPIDPVTEQIAEIEDDLNEVLRAVVAASRALRRAEEEALGIKAKLRELARDVSPPKAKKKRSK